MNMGFELYINQNVNRDVCEREDEPKGTRATAWLVWRMPPAGQHLSDPDVSTRYLGDAAQFSQCQLYGQVAGTGGYGHCQARAPIRKMQNGFHGLSFFLAEIVKT